MTVSQFFHVSAFNKVPHALFNLLLVSLITEATFLALGAGRSLLLKRWTFKYTALPDIEKRHSIVLTLSLVSWLAFDGLRIAKDPVHAYYWDRLLAIPISAVLEGGSMLKLSATASCATAVAACFLFLISSFSEIISGTACGVVATISLSIFLCLIKQIRYGVDISNKNFLTSSTLRSGRSTDSANRTDHSDCNRLNITDFANGACNGNGHGVGNCHNGKRYLTAIFDAVSYAVRPIINSARLEMLHLLNIGIIAFAVPVGLVNAEIYVGARILSYSVNSRIAGFYFALWITEIFFICAIDVLSELVRPSTLALHILLGCCLGSAVVSGSCFGFNFSIIDFLFGITAPLTLASFKLFDYKVLSSSNNCKDVIEEP